MLPGRDVHAAGVSPRCGRSRPGGPTSGRRSDPGGPVLLFLVHTDNAIYDAVRVIDAIQGLDAELARNGHPLLGAGAWSVGTI